MKKHIILTILLLMILCVLLAGCLPDNDQVKNSIKSIYIHEASPNSFSIDEPLNLSDVKLVVEYKDGRIEIIPVSEAMISNEDRTKFSTVGSGITVLIHYGGRSVPYSFEVLETRQEKKYYVDFESNGGSKVESLYVSVIEAFTMPERPGYTFMGWYTNPDFVGQPCIAPYPLGKDTIFYARWDDNRKYKVDFLDHEGEIYVTHIVTYGDSIPLDKRPPGPPREGFIFVEWLGVFDNITENTQIIPSYTPIICEIRFYTDYQSAEQDFHLREVNWGDSLDSSKIPEFPAKEGYTGEWHILNEFGLTEEITDQLIRITSNIDVIPVYQIISYRVTFQDDEQFAGTGTSWETIEKIVNHGSDLSLTTGDNADVSEPQEREGHTAEWAVLIDDKWIKIDGGNEWDDENQEWKPISNPSTTIEIKNSAGDIIAVVKEGVVISSITGNVQLRAKYVKNKYDLRFFRGAENLLEINGIKFGTKFSLYKLDDSLQQEGIVYGPKPKNELLKYDAEEDWDIEWYPNSTFNDYERIDFENSAYIIVKDNKDYYCKDIDLRKYEVEFYDWDFQNNMPFLISVLQYLDGEWVNVERQSVPHGGDPVIPTVENKLEYGYVLVDAVNFWYDAPQGKGYAKPSIPTEITKNMKFYAHYRILSYSVILREFYYPYNSDNADYFKALNEMPEVTYYKDEQGNDLDYGYVMMDAVYSRNFGHQFTDDEIYFGGDDVYQKLQFIENYRANETLYNQYLADIDNIRAESALYEGYLNKIRDYQQKILDYTITPEEKDEYAVLIQNYDLYRERLYEAEQKIEFVNRYKIQYYQEGDELPEGKNVGDEIDGTGFEEKEYLLFCYGAKDENGDYIKDEFGNYVYLKDQFGDYMDNGDYDRLKNLRYATTGREGYEFDGWFTSPNFNINTRISVNEEEGIFTRFEVNRNYILYAKWIDLNMGSGGLVFQLIEADDPEEIGYYQIIDYLSLAQFNDLYSTVNIDGVNYYKKANSDILIPVTHLSYNDFPDTIDLLDKELRLPAFHKGVPVKRLVSGLFKENSDIIVSIDIPNNVEIIDEGVFSSCYKLALITKADENQFFSINNGVLYTDNGKTLLCYPAKLVIPEYYHDGILVPSDTFIVPADVTRIAKGAFMHCDQLLYIAFEDGTQELVFCEDAFRALLNLKKIGRIDTEPRDGNEVIIADEFLPDRLIAIESYAFKDCVNLKDITATLNSSLLYVGENILEGTGWYYLKNMNNTTYVNGTTASDGILMLGYVALGVTSDYNKNSLIFDGNYVKAIADAAFYNNTLIHLISLENTQFAHIGRRAFDKCTNLNTVNLYNTHPESFTIGDSAFHGFGANFTIYIPHDTLEEYILAEGWSDYADYFIER